MEVMELLAVQDTALSESVHRLLCVQGVVDIQDDLSVSPANYSLNLGHISRLLPSDDATPCYYEQAVCSLAPVFARCQGVMDGTATCNLVTSLQPFLLWTGNEKLFLDCLAYLEKSWTSSWYNNLVLLLMSAGLERALGNLYLIKGIQCPSLLKDLLATQELTEILGDHVMQVLRVLIGSPASLNLRNIVWHGFFGDEELPHRYCCFLFLLTSSIGRLLDHSGYEVQRIPHRPYISWSNAVQEKMLTQGMAFSEDTLRDVKRTILSSKLAQPLTVHQWKLAFRLYKEGRYGYSLALVLPLLEHSLRRIFAGVNGCPGRMLTAESTSLYTTYTEMLEQFMSDGSVNQLSAFLGSPCMDLLLDLLSYPEGPRVRDRLSHGEVDFQTVSHCMVDPFIHLAVFLADKMTVNNVIPALTPMVERVNSYRSKFHPIAVLQHKINTLLSKLEISESLVLITPGFEELSQSQTQSVLHQDNALLKSTQRTVSKLWLLEPWTQGVSGFHLEHFISGFGLHLEPLHKYSQQHFNTSLRWQGEVASNASGQMREQEFVGLLTRITEECCTAVQQVQQALQLRQRQFFEKQLRSRQRDNLQKLLLCVPCLQVLGTVTAAAVCWHLQLLHRYSSLTPGANTLLHRQLKLCLQHCENLRSNTAADKNKWTEGIEQMVRFIQNLEQFLTKWIEVIAS